MAVTGNDASGERTIAYTCSYVPEEILLAAGLTPWRMIPRAHPSEADPYLYPNTCSYVKSLMAAGLSGAASGAGAVVFANSCAGMRRLHDLWSQYVKAVPALFIDVPKKNDPPSVEFFASELRTLARRLEELFPGSRVTEEKLEDAIAACNDVRMLMDKVFSLQKDPNKGVSGSAVLGLCLEGARSHPARFAETLKGFLAGSRQEQASAGAPRIVITANLVHGPELIELIEGLGGRVVVLDSCIGVRHYDRLVARRAGDPMQALAERYLLRASCARMEGIEDRFQRLRRMAAEFRADGIVYSTLKFCDTYLYETPLMRMTCEDAGMSFLLLENEYAWTGLEQMKTRVESFLAVIGEREAT
ncbi:MAG: 2-hydroxyacyl-CoA dehydratase family protein [bacterium]